MTQTLDRHHAALVTRPAVFGQNGETYLVLTGDGRPQWTADPAAATAFTSMREAARAAFRLPSEVKAYGVLRAPEIEALVH